MAVGKRSSKSPLQEVLGKGANISEVNPLEVHDAKVGSLISYEGVTTADGAADGSSLIDNVLTTKPEYDGHWVVITSGPYFGQCSDITGATTGGTVTAHEAFDGQILRGTKFVILAMKALPAEVAALTALVNALVTDIEGATGIFHEQADVAFNVNAVLAAEADILHLNDADTRYIVRSLRLKCVDPGVETVTVRLYELVFNVLTEVDSFAITNANFETYQSLMDMFGLNHLAGDELQVTVQATAAGPYAVTGQYSYAKTNV